MIVLRALVCVFVVAFAARASAAVQLTQIATGVPNLVGIEHAGDGTNRLFLVNHAGLILISYAASTPQLLATPFLYISPLVRFDGEQGLLGLAFHPNYVGNGFFYVNYVNTSGDTVIARFQVTADPNIAD